MPSEQWWGRWNRWSWCCRRCRQWSCTAQPELRSLRWRLWPRRWTGRRTWRGRSWWLRYRRSARSHRRSFPRLPRWARNQPPSRRWPLSRCQASSWWECWRCSSTSLLRPQGMRSRIAWRRRWFRELPGRNGQHWSSCDERGHPPRLHCQHQKHCSAVTRMNDLLWWMMNIETFHLTSRGSGGQCQHQEGPSPSHQHLLPHVIPRVILSQESLWKT